MFTLFPPRLKEVLQLGLSAAHKVLLANSAAKHVGKEEDIVDTLGVGSKRKRHVGMYGSESGEMVKQKSENSFSKKEKIAGVNPQKLRETHSSPVRMMLEPSLSLATMPSAVL